MVVLDTDHISLLQRADGVAAQKLLSRIVSIPPSQAVTTIISYEEQMRGWMGLIAKARTVADQVRSYRKLQRHLEYFAAIPILPFDEIAATEFQGLARNYRRIASMDLKIAAIALSRKVTLLTRNLRDFRQISGLSVEDWTA